jgi:hypothetical protein
MRHPPLHIQPLSGECKKIQTIIFEKEILNPE